MAAEGIFPALAIRSSVGVELWSSTGIKAPFIPHQSFSRDESKFCRAIVFSPDGRFLAWANGTKIQVCSTKDWNIICSISRPKSLYLKFSPNGNYLMSWELFTTTKENPDGSPNLYIYLIESGEEVFSTIQKKHSDWEPSWSNDESILALMLGGEAFFYETKGPDGFKKSTKKIGGIRNGLLSVAPGNNNPYVTFYVPGVKGSASMCKIFKYPDLQATQPIGCKSFFQADRVEMMWNKRGIGLLLLTSMDVDQSGASYYGKQALHFMSSRGDSFAVPLNKEGPIHAVSWNPNSSEFCVIYGFMPSKASFFNLKCDSTFECKEGSRNCIYYNPFGNIVILAGFGNLRGNVEVWNVAKKTQIATLQAPDSTLLEWCPNGETFVTATTSPRLRMGNGFKIWHYSGALLHETFWQPGQELLEVIWQISPNGMWKENPISNSKIEGIKSSQPLASAQAYKPPNVRGIIIAPKVSADNIEDKNRISGLPPGYASKKLSRNHKRAKDFRNKKDSKSDDKSNSESNTVLVSQSMPELLGNEVVDAQPRPRQSKDNITKAKWNPPVLNEDPEKNKRMKLINKKLHDISKLKLRREKGEHLEVNQISKINMESDLINELNALKIP